MSKRPSFWLLILPLLVSMEMPSAALCQEVGLEIASVEGGDSPSKFENGLQIFWRNTAEAGDPNSNEADPEAKVEMFEGAKRQLAVCHVADVLRAADPSFTGVSIYDVSARKPGFIAVAAVYTRGEGSSVAVLLYFDWDGLLLRRTVLHGRPEIQSLEMNSDGYVWALNGFTEDDRDSFVFSKFDTNGRVVREAIKLQPHWSTDEGMSTGGQTSFGMLGNCIWAWLPKSRTFLSFDDDAGRTEIQSTGFPHLEDVSGIYARQAVLLHDGQLLMDVGWMKGELHGSGWFTWSRSSGWKQVHQAPDYLRAVEGDKVIFEAFTRGNQTTFRLEGISDLLANR